ncbi:flagellar hook assembly protein FlgD [Oceanobacillus halophilus]|uniref:Flagellar hook assembly protein FlgD n=1 Tax=Oceanobacillus halophilus TaxID=930130 RepID=A0A495ABZ3_9BACI|nr:flagellar hook assembly protein FlgD [Oceanobacillus halophilus]RKQ37488.1 flagellar hook assembly protein FlgD [Oceanobacillus halophilus]
MNTIDPSFYLSNQKITREPSPTLDKDGFLKILMTQLQNQDPTDPMDDNAMVEQMATLTSLEQVMNMSSAIETLVQSQVVSPVIQYSHMIGKEVMYQQSDDQAESEKNTVKGNVVAVSQKEGLAIFELDNGEKIYADAVTKIGHSSIEANGTE